MKIIENRKPKQALFGNLRNGTVFMTEGGGICIKTSEIQYGENIWNSVCISSGDHTSFDSGEFVTPLQCELIITG